MGGRDDGGASEAAPLFHYPKEELMRRQVRNFERIQERESSTQYLISQ